MVFGTVRNLKVAEERDAHWGRVAGQGLGVGDDVVERLGGGGQCVEVHDFGRHIRGIELGLHVSDLGDDFGLGFAELGDDSVNGFLGGHDEPSDSESEETGHPQGETADDEGDALKNHGVAFPISSSSRSTARDHKASLGEQ